MEKKVRFLFLSWRDIRSPKSGGAEVHTHELMKCFSHEGCEVIHYAPLYDGLPSEEIIEGIKYIRRGGVFGVILWAWQYYLKNGNDIDFVVDQCNTHRFFTRFWVPQDKRIFFIHQLTREIWDVNMPFPLNWIGKHTENLMLRLQRKDWTITVSESTKEDLISVGFLPERIAIIPNAANTAMLGLGLPDLVSKKRTNFIFAGRYSKYKGIDAAIEAVGIVKRNYKDVKLHIIGKKDERFIVNFIMPIIRSYGLSCGSDDSNDIVLHGFVGENEKYKLMRDSRALLFPSIREGWGIIVTEAAALGTPSIVYDSPGCRDAVDYGRAGYMCKSNTPEELARIMVDCMENDTVYSDIRQAAYDFAQTLSWDKNVDRVRWVLRLISA